MNTGDTSTRPADVQQDVQGDAPERDPAHPKGRAGRDGRGRFTAGHFHAATTGLHTSRLPPEFAHVQAQVDRFLAGALTDEGDTDDVPTRRRSQLAYRAVVHQKILQLSEALERRGLFDSRGRLRVAWITQLNALLSQARQQDQLLGLERRTKSAGGSALAAYRAEHQQRQGGTTNDEEGET